MNCGMEIQPLTLEDKWPLDSYVISLTGSEKVNAGEEIGINVTWKLEQWQRFCDYQDSHLGYKQE